MKKILQILEEDKFLNKIKIMESGHKTDSLQN